MVMQNNALVSLGVLSSCFHALKTRHVLGLLPAPPPSDLLVTKRCEYYQKIKKINSAFQGICHSFSEAYLSSNELEPTVAPKFMSRGHLYKAIIGDIIILPCKVQDLGMNLKIH